MPGEKIRLFCLQESISNFAWTLFLIKDSLTPLDRSKSKVSRETLLAKQTLGYLGLVKRNIRFLRLFIGYKLQWIKKEVVVELPCYGQLCVRIHRGHKVFDFYRNIVIKVFDHHVNSFAIREEVELLKVVSRFEFAPNLKEWNVEEGWYAEEYVHGALDSSYTPMDSATVKQKFSDVVTQPLIQIMLFQKPIRKNSLEYVLDLTGKPPLQAAPGTKYPDIVSFMDSMMNRLRTKGNDPIYLGFSHGDFVPANMLNTPKGIKIIDWEGAGYRSALYDFYTYYFYRPAHRNVSVSTVIQEIQEALPLFLAELTKGDQEISLNIQAMERVYRWTFYIELICRLLDRKMTDRNLDIESHIHRYLLSFHEYEAILDGKEECVSTSPNDTTE